MLWPGMRFSLRSQCKRCSAGRLQWYIPTYAVDTCNQNPRRVKEAQHDEQIPRIPNLIQLWFFF